MLKLLVTAGSALGAEIRIEAELEIGRDAEGEGALGGDLEISRRHARITNTPNGYTIEDLGSSNGTFLNGRAVEAPELLTPGDALELGSTTLFVEQPFEGRAAADPAPEPVETAAPPFEEATAPASDEVAAAIAALDLRIDIDFDPPTARLQFGEGGGVVTFEQRDGEWRLDSP